MEGTNSIIKARSPIVRTVSDVMTVHVHVANATTPFKLLARLIAENRVGAIPIVDQQGAPIGIVSDTDLLMADRWQGRFKTDGVCASEIMAPVPITIESDTSLTAAVSLMKARRVRHLVVVDERGGIAGIVSRSDLTQ
jgi:CBS domain-containing protein